MLFGRAFELALGAYFRREDPGDVFFREWSRLQASRPAVFRTATPGIACSSKEFMLLHRFCQDNRVEIRTTAAKLQIKFTRPIGRNEFVAYVDAIGKLDGKRCLLEWKTSSCRYAEEPDGVLALDPQMVCYSWITGIAEVAQVVFVRKRLVEIQYLRTTITDEQRQEFGQLVEDTIASNRIGPVPASQRGPLSRRIRAAVAPTSGLCLGKARHGGCRTDAASRSRRPWLA